MRSLRTLSGVTLLASVTVLAGQSTQPAGDEQSLPNVLGGPAFAQQPPPAELALPYESRVDITTRIPAEALAVRIVSSASRGFLMPLPEGMSEAERLTRSSEAVGVFRVIRKTGELNETRDWIFSIVDAEVLEVLKPSATGKLVDGQPTVSFRAPGGSITVRGTLVTAINTNYEQVEPGKTYVIFLRVDPDGRLRTWPHGQFDIRDGTLRNLDRSGTPLLGSRADEELVKIRAARSLPAPTPKGGAR